MQTSTQYKSVKTVLQTYKTKHSLLIFAICNKSQCFPYLEVDLSNFCQLPISLSILSLVNNLHCSIIQPTTLIHF